MKTDQMLTQAQRDMNNPTFADTYVSQRMDLLNENEVNFIIKGGDIDTNLISDGYHTFGELYDFRKVLNAALFNEWAAQGKYNVQKSQHHSDGDPCFGGGWFIVVAELPTGQISNHYEMKDWDLFKIPSVGIPVKFDGHTAADVLERLQKLF